MTQASKPFASLSLDLDNQWSYMKTHGDAGWEDFPSYFSVLIPRVLDCLARQDLTVTFFIVGQDAALEMNHEALAQIGATNHEIGNHSFHHEPWLHLYTDEELASEFSRAEDAIASATGMRPNGFRGPGFSFSRSVLETLKKRGYRYDASTFPTYLGPIARAYYFFTANLSAEERKQRDALFGKASEGLRPLKPYLWDLDAGPLLEVPVTTMPVFKAPFHLSYLIYLASYSRILAQTYFASVLRVCRLAGVEPSFLLHPLDFLSGEDVDCLKFFPGMSMPLEKKLEFAEWVLATYKKHFNVVPMGRHADAILADKRPRRRPAPPPTVLHSRPLPART